MNGPQHYIVPLSVTLLFSSAFLITCPKNQSVAPATHKKPVVTKAAVDVKGNPIMSSLYNLEIKARDGSIIKLSDFKGKVILIVNIAPDSWFVSQLKDLEALYERFKDQGLVVIGVFSDDFGHNDDYDPRTQHPTDHYMVDFILTDKVHVIDQEGEYQAHPLFKWLNREANKTSITYGNMHSSFYKFLIGKHGQFIDWFAPMTSPESGRVVKAIQRALAE